MTELRIPLTITSEYSLNKIYSGRHWAIRKQDKDTVAEIVGYAILQQKVKREDITKPAKLEFYYNDRLDCSNHGYVTKIIEDALKGVLIKDDTKRYVRGVYQGIWDGEGILLRILEVGE